MACDGDRSMAVVCDGVASTHDAHRASLAAAESAGRVLDDLLRARRWPANPALLTSFRRAVRAAQAAVGALTEGREIDAELSPSTTLVAAFSTPGHLVVAGIGDSRAYWLDDAPDRSRLLTVDDSWAEEQIAAGTDPERAYADPEAHTITRWIGAGADRVDVEITVLDVSEPGLLVLCSDGLWNYFEAPERLARAGLRGHRPGPDRYRPPPGAVGTTGRGPRQRHRGRPARGATAPFRPPSRHRRGAALTMADFQIECFQNEFLPEGADLMHAVITVTATGTSAARRCEEATECRSGAS